jgi:primosomal protein N' (replication factor Y)
VAIQRSKLENCIVVLGTATPSLESYYHTQQGKFHLISMPSRIGGREMPKVEIIDMREELKSKNRSIFSRSLLTEITDRLTKNEQTILFLNRRGYSSYVFCRNCGHVEKCEVCSVSMTYHFSKQRTVCHHCGAEKRTPRSCPSCTSENIRYLGLGTERVEQEVLRAFPQAKVQRMDTDSTLQKNAHQTILDRFNNQEIDILVGTQMIAKGLDFPNVTLVGVIIADTALNLPDFRASERSFNLLTQVAGRSGRSNLEGKVIVQTYMPDHYGIQAAKNHDYVGFYNQEIMFRKELNYPPLSHVATILVRGTAEEEVISTANDLRSILDLIQADHFPNIEVRGPVAAPLSKIKAKHRWHLLVKCESSDDLRETIHAMNQSTRTNFTPTSVEKIVDIDPISML